MPVTAESADRVEPPAKNLLCGLAGRVWTFLVSSHVAMVVVWTVWALLLLTDIGFVHKYAVNVPLGDEWFVLPSLLHAEPFDAEFLWRRHNEHRIPVPKLVLYSIYRASNYDFRAAAYCNTLALGALAAMLMLAARALRGRQSLTDIVFPLLFMNWSHSENMIWGFQVTFMSSVTLNVLLLLALALRKRPLSLRGAVAMASAVCALALSGQNGVALVGPFCLNLGWSALRMWGSEAPRPRLRAMAMAALSLLPLVVVALVFYRLESLPGLGSREVIPIFKTAREFLLNGLGRAAAFSRDPLKWFLASLLLSTCAILAVTWWRRAEERDRVVGLACAILSVLALAVVIGFGRAGGYTLRYTTLAAPFYAAICFVWILYAPRKIAWTAPLLLAATCGWLFPLNQIEGEKGAVELHAKSQPFHDALVQGTPMPILIGDHALVAWGWKEILDRCLPELKRRGIHDFANIPDDTRDYVPQEVPLLPAAVQDATFAENILDTRTSEGAVTLALAESRAVDAVRLVGNFNPGDGRVAVLRIRWRNSQTEDFSDARSRYYILDKVDDSTHTISATVGGNIDQIQIQPSNFPVRFRIERLELLDRTNQIGQARPATERQ